MLLYCRNSLYFFRSGYQIGYCSHQDESCSSWSATYISRADAARPLRMGRASRHQPRLQARRRRPPESAQRGRGPARRASRHAQLGVATRYGALARRRGRDWRLPRLLTMTSTMTMLRTNGFPSREPSLLCSVVRKLRCRPAFATMEPAMITRFGDREAQPRARVAAEGCTELDRLCI